MVRVRNHGTPSRPTTWAATVSMRDRLAQAEQLAQPLRLLRPRRARLQLRLELPHPLLEPAVLLVGLAVERPAPPGLAHPAHDRPHPALQRRSAARSPRCSRETPPPPSTWWLIAARWASDEAHEEEPAPPGGDGEGHGGRAYSRLIFRRRSKSESIFPVPSTTELRGSSATDTGSPVSSRSRRSRFLRSAPPPVSTMPRSTMSARELGRRPLEGDAHRVDDDR